MTTKSGGARYPNRGPGGWRGAHATADGTPLNPVDVYIVVKRLLRLTDDELIQAFAQGAAALAEGAEGYLAAVDDKEAEIAAAASVTRSRLVAWRKRGKSMRWDELRVWLLGLQTMIEAGDLDD